VRDKHALCDLGAMSESHPCYAAMIRELINGFDVSAGDIEQGRSFIVNALRGFAMRHHFDRYHADLVEQGIKEAPAEGPPGGARDAWLFGYRFVERKAGELPGAMKSDGNSRESDGTKKCATREHVESIDKPGFCVWCDLPRWEWVPLVMRKEPTDV
jgi:hypothetical protein